MHDKIISSYVEKGVEAFLFSHQKRIDASFPLNYSVYLNGQPLPISAPEQIAATYGRIQPGGLSFREEKVLPLKDREFGNVLNDKEIGRVRNRL